METKGRPAILKAYRQKMKAAGFTRLQVMVHPDLIAALKRERKPTECGGRCLERLVLGAARPRPGFSALLNLLRASPAPACVRGSEISDATRTRGSEIPHAGAPIQDDCDTSTRECARVSETPESEIP